ncbi:hypothetical protein ACFXG4_38285 [Nocardia sp. NPDC059246]|uniref:hypothetical protein n=1 Tax=unclassified Nocardia TaxID=2637762 RepID=UPI0036A058EA
MTKQVELDTKVAKTFVWSAVALVAGLIVAQGFLMHFIPGPDPTLSAEALRQRFIDRRGAIQLGSLLQIIVWSFWATWGMVVTVFIRRMERSYPFLTYASIGLVGGGSVFFLLIPMTWAVCAFRAPDMAPQIIQFANDWVWFDWLFTWPPFAIWFFVIAWAIFKDHNVPTIYPRWVGYFNVWCGLLIFPAGLIAFFHSGPFAYNGIGAFWFPVFVFFGEIVVMIVVSMRVINQQAARLQSEAEVAATV